jgi:hypothetical protein
MRQRFFNGVSIFLKAVNTHIWEHATYIERKITTPRVLRKLFLSIEKRILTEAARRRGTIRENCDVRRFPLRDQRVTFLNYKLTRYR